MRSKKHCYCPLHLPGEHQICSMKLDRQHMPIIKSLHEIFFFLSCGCGYHFRNKMAGENSSKQARILWPDKIDF